MDCTKEEAGEDAPIAFNLYEFNDILEAGKNNP